MLPRLHLFEFTDQAWCPPALRDHLTDYLHTVETRTHVFDSAVGVLARGLRASPEPVLVDLASGGGGPLPLLRGLLARDHGLNPRVLLTDLYPSDRGRARAQAAGVEYLEQPVDARAVPASLRGMRTLFNALHHFRPEEARAVLADAQRQRVPIAVFEIVRRTPAGVLSMLGIPLLVLLFTPFMRPLTPARLLLTYALPVAPLAIGWDGLVSSLRAHRPEEVRRWTQEMGTEGYAWEIGMAQRRGRPAISYVLGVPTQEKRGGHVP